MFVNVILIIIGLILLVKGADFLVDGSSSMARKFKIPQIVIGLTIVAIGTSTPELVVSLSSAMNGHSDIAIGNVIGSNLVNLLFILGLCAIIKPLPFKQNSVKFEIPFSIIVTVLLFILCINGSNIITRGEGAALLVLCFLFILYNIRLAKKSKDTPATEEIIDENKKPFSMLKSIGLIVIGIIGLKFGGDFVVNGSIEIASILGISEKIIGLTIVAIGTSLPELFTSVVATRKGETDIAIGNILGSQIFNILLIIGVSALISPITYAVSYNKDIILLIISSIIFGLFPFLGQKNYMTRKNGIFFVIVYIIFIVSLIFLDA